MSKDARNRELNLAPEAGPRRIARSGPAPQNEKPFVTREILGRAAFYAPERQSLVNLYQQSRWLNTELAGDQTNSLCQVHSRSDGSLNFGFFSEP